MLEYIGDPQGSVTFQGTGNYGYGDKRQLATFLDPSVKYIEDLEEAEINQNLYDLHKTLGKYDYEPSTGPIGPNEPARMDNRGIASNPKGPGSNSKQQVSFDPYGTRDWSEEDEEIDNLEERNQSDMFYTDLPGFPPMNTLEKYGAHTPSTNHEENIEQTEDNEEAYAEYVNQVEELNEYGYWSFMKGTRSHDQKWRGDKHETVQFNDEQLVDPKDHLDLPPQESTPHMTYGVVVSPRKFIPDDQPKELNQPIMKQQELEEFVQETFKEIFFEEVVPYLEDEEGEPTGGSKSFIDSREEVLKQLEKEDPNNPEFVKDINKEKDK